MKTIPDILTAFRAYLDITTPMANSSKDKYVKIVRLFLLRKGLVFNMTLINKFISESNKSNNNYNYKAAFKHFLISIGQKKMAESLVHVKKKPRKKVFIYIEKCRVQQIINMLPGKYKYMAFIQYKTGLRFQEMITLRAENIDYNIHPNLIYITVGVNKSKTKLSKERKIRLSNKYLHIIQKLAKNTWGYIFLPSDFEKYDEDKLLMRLDSIRRMYDSELTRVGKINGIDGLSSHYLRHLFADEFILAGGSEAQLKIIMGHSRIDTTLDYVSIGDAAADNILVKMEAA